MRVFRQLWELPSKLDVHIKAGSRLYVGGPGVVEAIDTAGQEPKVVWHAEIEGTPQRMLAADEKLFVVTAEGSILAFAARQPGEVTTHAVSDARASAADEWTERAKAILGGHGRPRRLRPGAGDRPRPPGRGTASGSRTCT